MRLRVRGGPETLEPPGPVGGQDLRCAPLEERSPVSETQIPQTGLHAAACQRGIERRSKHKRKEEVEKCWP